MQLGKEKIHSGLSVLSILAVLLLCSRMLFKYNNLFCCFCHSAKLFIVGSNSSSSTRNAVDMGKQNFNFYFHSEF